MVTGGWQIISQHYLTRNGTNTVGDGRLNQKYVVQNVFGMNVVSYCNRCVIGHVFVLRMCDWSDIVGQFIRKERNQIKKAFILRLVVCDMIQRVVDYLCFFFEGCFTGDAMGFDLTRKRLGLCENILCIRRAAYSKEWRV